MKRARTARGPREVFLSHSSRDRQFARRLAEALRAHGVPVWYSEASLVGAQQWHDKIGAALARCDWFLILLSPNATRSEWVKRELHYALRTARYADRIVPLRYRKCNVDKLSWTLDSFQAVNFSKSFDAGCRDLLRVWGVGFDAALI